jgi:hypothetical protein
VALSRFVVTARVTLTPDAAAALAAGEPGTGSAAGYGNVATTGGPLWPVTYLAGTPVVLDSAGPLYAAIGAGNLRAWADTDAVSHAALANLAVGSTP